MNLKNLYKYDLEELEEILDKAENTYYNNTNELILLDNEFDYIKEYVIQHYPNSKYIKKIGTENKNINKVKLPVWMGSMTNFKDNKQIENFKKKYKENYIIMSKLDGISGLLYKKGNIIKLYTRGNGRTGRDISYLLEYLDIPNLNFYNDLIIRGELIIKLNDFDKIKNKSANERSLISGIVNSKKENINKETIKYLKFIGYELLHPQCKIEEQLKILKSLKLEIVDNIKIEKINLELLQKYLEKFKKNSKYLIDGIIIRHNENYEYNKSGNPDYAFAFKMILKEQIKESIIKNIHWNISKFGKLFPQIEIKEINIGGENIKFISGKSGKFIFNNKLNKGSIIKVIRSCDVIPDIYEIIKSSTEPLMPNIKYNWNETKTDIFINDNNNEIKKIKLIIDFFKSIGTENLGEGIIKKLYNNNYNSIDKIINIKKEELLNIKGIKDKLAVKLLNNIKESLYKCNIIDIMNASNIFGSGYGKKRLEIIYYNIENVLNISNKNELFNKIRNLKGFSDITAKQFVNNMDNFNLFLKNNNLEYKKEIIKKKNKIEKNIVLTGFRDKNLEKILLKFNIEINDIINNNTIYVIYKNENKNSKKILLAKEKNIKIIEKDEFINNINNYF